MDRQKIFWVVLAVSVFVVVVLVVGVLLLRQKPGLAAAPGVLSPLSDPGTQVFEYARPQAGSEGTEEMNFVIGDTGEPAAGTGVPPQEPNEPAAKEQLAPPASAREPVPAPAAPAVPAQKRPAAQPPAARTAPDAGRGPQYWIQTGSYRSQTRAEELATMLEGKGLAGRVFSYSSGPSTFFRVRVGPYANKGEAEKFLSTVRRIQGLEASYISMMGAKGKVN
jgi:cell division protein FtsN